MQQNNSNNRTSLKTSIIGSITGLIATAITIIAVITSNSMAAVADMMATFFDFIAIFLAFLTLRKINKNQVLIYNYGFGKLEAIINLCVASLMFGSLIIILYNTFLRFANPVAVSGFGLWLLFIGHLFFFFINISLFIQSVRSSKLNKSSIIISQAKIFGIKAFANFSMFTSVTLNMFFPKYGFILYLDPAVSILIALMIFWAAFDIMKNSVNDILDKTAEENHQMTILKILANFFDNYIDLDNIRSRKVGKIVFIEIFLKFDGTKYHSEIQQNIDNMKKSIELEIPNSDVSIVSTSCS